MKLDIGESKDGKARIEIRCEDGKGGVIASQKITCDQDMKQVSYVVVSNPELGEAPFVTDHQVDLQSHNTIKNFVLDYSLAD